MIVDRRQPSYTPKMPRSDVPAPFAAPAQTTPRNARHGILALGAVKLHAVGWVCVLASSWAGCAGGERAGAPSASPPPRRDSLIQAAQFRQAGEFDKALQVCERLRSGSRPDESERALISLEMARTYEARAAKASDPAAAAEDRRLALHHADEALRFVSPTGPRSREWMDAVWLLGRLERQTGHFERAAKAFLDLSKQGGLTDLERARAAGRLCSAYVDCAARADCPLEGDVETQSDRLVAARARLQDSIDQVSKLSSCPPEVTAALLVCAGNLERNARRPGQAVELFRQARAKLGDDAPKDQVILLVTNQLAAAVDAGDYGLIRGLSRELQDAAEGDPGPDAHNALGAALMELGELESARAEFAIAGTLARGDAARLAQININAAGCAQQLGRFDEARRYLEEAVKNAVNAGLDPRSRLILQRNVGRFHFTLYRLNEAQAELTKVWEEQKSLFSSQDVEALKTEVDLALIQYHRGDFGQAAERMQRIVESLATALGDDHTGVADARLQLATIEANTAGKSNQKYCESALEATDRAVAVLDKALGWGHLRSVQAAAGKLQVAERCRQVTGDATPVAAAFTDVAPRLERLESQLGEDNVFVAESKVTFAGISAEWKPEEALRRIDEAEAAYRKHVPSSDRCHPAIIRLLEAKARIHSRMGDYRVSLDVCRTGLECSADWFTRHPLRANLLGAMATDQWNLGAKDEARRTFAQAYELLITTYPQEHPWVKEFQQRHRELSEAAAEP